MFRRTPSYAVTTYALVLIAAAAFGVRYAARFLPERRPNDLSKEYGEYVRRSMRETVHWYAFGDEGFRQAAALDKIVFLDVGTVMSLSAKRFSEDYATDGEYRRLLHDHFEAIKVDALEMPWIVDALNIETEEKFVDAERFLAVTMGHKGGMVRSTQLLAQGGDESLAAWLESLARLRYSNPGEVDRLAAESLAGRQPRAIEALSHGPCNPDVVRAWAGVWQQAARTDFFRDRKMEVTTLPMEVLAHSGNEQAEIDCLNLLLDLAMSPCHDIVDGGFFIFADDPHWRLPVGSKLTGHSLQVAALFAEVGVRNDIPLFREIARRTTEWAKKRIHAGLFDAGLGTDQDADGYSPYYRVEAGDVEVLPFYVGQSGFPRPQVLGSFAANVSERRAAQLLEGAEKLQTARRSRKLPRRDAGQYADQNGQAISGLFRIAAALDERAIAQIAIAAYSGAKAAYVQPLGDVLHAPTGGGRTTAYSGDYAWMTRAAIDGYRATGEAQYLEDARLMTSRMLELFRGESGALMSYLPSQLEAFGYGIEVYRVDDSETQSANALAALNLADLAALTQSSQYRLDAEGIIRAFSGKFAESASPAGIVLAGLRLYDSKISPAKR
ncbi:MAG: DUF255 domain-containing protein [Fimbriimonadales bacterium]